MLGHFYRRRFAFLKVVCSFVQDFPREQVAPVARLKSLSFWNKLDTLIPMTLLTRSAVEQTGRAGEQSDSREPRLNTQEMGNPLPNQLHNEQTNLESRAGEARRLLEHLFATLPRLLSFRRSNVPDLASFTESATLECIAELHETTIMLENSVFPIMRECMEQHDNIIETNLLDVLLLRD
jgi:hypothetical protein